MVAFGLRILWSNKVAIADDMTNLDGHKLLIGIGVEKCGTTSLFSFLSLYSNLIAIPRLKETRFFSDKYEYGESHYLSLFKKEDLDADKWLLDFTPGYFRRQKTLERISGAKVKSLVSILLLRNPVQRAFSHYWHDIYLHVTRGQRGHTDIFKNHSFEVLAAQKDRYLFTTYSSTIRRAQKLFGSNLIVGIFEDLIDEPTSIIKQLNNLCDFEIPEDSSMPRSNEKKYAFVHEQSQGDFVRQDEQSNIEKLPFWGDARVRLLAAQGSFSHKIGKEVCEQIYENLFQEDVTIAEELLQVELHHKWKQRELKSPLFKV